MPEATPTPVDGEAEQVLLQLPLGDVVRLQALLLSAQDARDEPIIEGWTDKIIDEIQQQAELDATDLAAYDDDVSRIYDTGEAIEAMSDNDDPDE